MKKVIVFIFVLALIASVGGNVYLYLQHQKDQKLINNPNTIYQNEEAKVISSVSKLMELPAGDTPTIATVLEKEKLIDQPFFKNAENGDKIIVFAQSKKAILYRESTNKIVEFAQIVLESEAQPTVAPTTTTKSVATPTPTTATEEL